jgi:polyisoprenoid-binding protein YceI
VPDLKFVAPRADCSPNGKALTCSVAGELAIRGRSRPLTIVLNIRNDGGSFKAVGDAVAKLSNYEIEAPSQFGVKTDDDVKLHLEFTATSFQQQASNGGVR